MKIPKKITPCPLIDAVVEVRFESDVLPDAIFGIIYQKIKSEYPKVDKLPILQLPDEIRFKDPNLKYNAYYRLTSRPFVVQIGPKVLTVSCPGEYIGWEAFFPKILETFDLLKELDIVDRIVRLGIRYINYFEFDIFEKINLRLMLKDDLLQSNQAMIKTQIQDDQFINTLQIANNATVTVEEKIIEGSIIDIDTYLDKEIENFFANMQNLITEAHETEKRLFFSLLKEEFLETLNPEY